MNKTNLLQRSDNVGCNFYRMFTPSQRAATMAKNIYNIDTPVYIFNEPVYKLLNMIMFRPSNLVEQVKTVKSFFAPLREKYGYWLIYNIDDIIVYDDIPPYNQARKAYEGAERMQGLKDILSIVDFVVVTTEELKAYYVEFSGESPDKFRVIPNYLPRWWAGEAFNVFSRMSNYTKHKRKPRIGITSSTSHYDVKKQNGGIDDFSHVVDFIRESVDKYQWVFVGTAPSALADLVQQRKIELHPGSDILNYLRELHDKELSLIVAPLQDNKFNRCKSNIKLLESWALGIPVIAQDLPLYSEYTDSVFTDAAALRYKIDELLKSPTFYKETMINNRKIIDFGDGQSSNGWWLEKNMHEWFRIFSMPKRPIHVTLDAKIQTTDHSEVVFEV